MKTHLLYLPVTCAVLTLFGSGCSKAPTESGEAKSVRGAEAIGLPDLRHMRNLGRAGHYRFEHDGSCVDGQAG